MWIIPDKMNNHVVIMLLRKKKQKSTNHDRVHLKNWHCIVLKINDIWLTAELIQMEKVQISHWELKIQSRAIKIESIKMDPLEARKH